MITVRETIETDFEYSELFVNTPNRYAIVNDINETVGLASFEFNTDNQCDTLNVSTVEIFYEGSGYASDFLYYLFQAYPISYITGETLSSRVFWSAVGAQIPEYSHYFTLSREDFISYYTIRQEAYIECETAIASTTRDNLIPIKRLDF